ncbi:uncharacterized protein LOC108044275 [Drosophila rhopaloa]|uniref:Uncharacterized protein LOC108044275 n=1 Tax=Drosophila rhopaloa TaxID=1041015 RepID=A0A6P4EKI3_DRORH|nr:uncharacterized protein LOC108044275 [Drosophila rhopaloa]
MMKTLMLLFLGVTSSWAADYEFLLEDPDILSPCTDGPPGAIDAREAVDFEHIVINAEADILHVSGNATVNWNVHPTDRITAKLELLHFNRGSWEPTVFTMNAKDFCSIMYDKNQYWYKYWTTYIINRDEVEEKCIKGPGVVLVHEPFDVRLKFMNLYGPTLRGRYKMVITFHALDDFNVPRPKPICVEIRGEFLKLK